MRCDRRVAASDLRSEPAEHAEPQVHQHVTTALTMTMWEYLDWVSLFVRLRDAYNIVTFYLDGLRSGRPMIH